MREYLKAREELLEFFLRYTYSTSVTKFNLVNNFPNNAERMRRFIDRFNKYFPDETFEFMIIHPADASIFDEELRHNVSDREIHSIKKSIKK